jgi:carboxymethylenebutenolidase
LTTLKALAICILTVFASGAVNARETGVIAGVKIETFHSGKTGPRPADVILSGSKGFASPAYDGIARQFSSAGIDVYLAHLLTADDLHQINSLQGAKQGVDYYEKRRKDWIGNTVKLLTALGKRPEYHGRIGVLGISLGAESAALAISSGAPSNAVVLVDGAPSHTPHSAKTPPFKLIWGSHDTVFPLATGAALRARGQQGGRTGHAECLSRRSRLLFQRYEAIKRSVQDCDSVLQVRTGWRLTGLGNVTSANHQMLTLATDTPEAALFLNREMQLQ